jgi:riboflavin synthase
MFTGLVQMLATVREVRELNPGRRIVLAAPELAADARLGDSIAVCGCCLTVVACDRESLAFEAGPETLQRTTLGSLAAGSRVNLEPSLRVGDRLGGHYVTGHVEATGRLESRRDQADWSTCWFSYPRELGRYIVPKGSIAVDGVSLTVVDVEPERFSVALIPHTLAATTLGLLTTGGRVNLETDLLAKYAQKQPAVENTSGPASG